MSKQQTAVEWFSQEINKINVSTEARLFINKLKEQALTMEKEESNAKIQKAIEKFEEAKSKSSSLKDIVYLDGVLAVLDTIKNETFKSE